jgi:hypothetical protein
MGSTSRFTVMNTKNNRWPGYIRKLLMRPTTSKYSKASPPLFYIHGLIFTHAQRLAQCQVCWAFRAYRDRVLLISAHTSTSSVWSDIGPAFLGRGRTALIDPVQLGAERSFVKILEM